MTGIEYREATDADVDDLAAIRAAEWGKDEYWRERIRGYASGALNPKQALAPRVIYVLAAWFAEKDAKRVCVDADPENPTARAFYRKNGAQDLNPHWLVWPDITSLLTLPP